MTPSAFHSSRDRYFLTGRLDYVNLCGTSKPNQVTIQRRCQRSRFEKPRGIAPINYAHYFAEDKAKEMDCQPGPNRAELLPRHVRFSASQVQTNCRQSGNHLATLPVVSSGGSVRRWNLFSQWTSTHSWSRKVRSLCGLILCSSVSE
jgi:hypothetical protein